MVLRLHQEIFIGLRTKGQKQNSSYLVSLPMSLKRSLYFTFPQNVSSAGMVVLVPKEDTCLAGDKVRVLLNYKLWLLPEHYKFPVSRHQQARKSVTTLVQLVHPDH